MNAPYQQGQSQIKLGKYFSIHAENTMFEMISCKDIGQVLETERNTPEGIL